MASGRPARRPRKEWVSMVEDSDLLHCVVDTRCMISVVTVIPAVGVATCFRLIKLRIVTFHLGQSAGQPICLPLMSSEIALKL